MAAVATMSGNVLLHMQPPIEQQSDAPRERKKPRKSVITSDAPKAGKRGRPRVNAQDESAAERRRTQIRLAQRAYRERKETTITELEKKVAVLQSSLDQVRNAIIDFQSLALGSGMEAWNPSLANALQNSVNRVLQLFDPDRQATVSSPEVTNHTGKATRDNRKRARSPECHLPQSSKALAEHRHQWMPPFSVPDYGEAQTLGYEFSYDNDMPIETESSSLIPNAAGGEWLNAAKDIQPKVQTLTPLFTESWMPPITQELQPIQNYDHAESSFARRYLRYCYERTYKVLTNPHSDPSEIHRRLRYSLCFGSVRMIAARLKWKLSRPRNEPIENWELPVLHVGGMGQHFPRDGIDDTIPPPQGFEVEHNIGPWRRPVDVAPEQVYPYQVAEWLGIEGVWYDCYDVEQYLCTKGIILDGSASVAAVTIDEDGIPIQPNLGLSSPNDNSTLSYDSPHSPLSPGAASSDLFESSVEQVIASMTEPSSLGSELASSAKIDYSSFGADGSLNSASHTFPIHIAPVACAPPVINPVPAPKTRQVAIDVDELLNALYERAICLGRSPGIQPEGVDRALQSVISVAVDML